MHKVCPKCGCSKPATPDYFYRDSVRKNGLRVYCIQCHKKYYKTNKKRISKVAKAYRERNKEQIRKQQKEWRRQNVAAIKARKRAYYIKHRERILQHKSDYEKTPKGKLCKARAQHRRRVKSQQSPATLTASQWENIISTQGNCCNICGCSFTESPPTKDHIIPVSKGGGLTKENVQALCRSCNSSKGAKITTKMGESFQLSV